MRYFICLLLLAGCEDRKAAQIRHCQEHGIPYRTGGPTREDHAGRFITLHRQEHKTDAELGEYLRLNEQLHQ